MFSPPVLCSVFPLRVESCACLSPTGLYLAGTLTHTHTDTDTQYQYIFHIFGYDYFFYPSFDSLNVNALFSFCNEIISVPVSVPMCLP